MIRIVVRFDGALQIINIFVECSSREKQCFDGAAESFVFVFVFVLRS